MRTLHGIFDVNNDGVISFDDFVMLAEKFGDLGHLSKQEMDGFLGVLKVSPTCKWSGCAKLKLLTLSGNLGEKLGSSGTLQHYISRAISHWHASCHDWQRFEEKSTQVPPLFVSSSRHRF